MARYLAHVDGWLAATYVVEIEAPSPEAAKERLLGAIAGSLHEEHYDLCVLEKTEGVEVVDVQTYGDLWSTSVVVEVEEAV